MKNIIIGLFLIVSLNSLASIPHVTSHSEITAELFNTILDKVNKGPEIMVVNMISQPSSVNYVSSTTSNVPIHSAEGDLFGSINTSSDHIILPAGKYYFHIPALMYKASTVHAILYNVTDSVEVKRAYAHPYEPSQSMTRANIKAVVELEKETEFRIRFTAGEIYSFQLEITKLK